MRLMKTISKPSAVVSRCGTYRYVLGRHLTAGEDFRRTILWVMLNPSTADATQDDHTIRRCMNFSLSWGYDILRVANLYAYRATNPKTMWLARGRGVDIVGPENDKWLYQLAYDAATVVIAMGPRHHRAPKRS